MTDPQTPPDPDVVPSSTPDGPSIIPTPGTPEGEPGPDPQPDPDSQERSPQAENAGTSLDQPSDGSGSA
ncbi:MAG: hypothetical protein H0V42_11060 [Nocardioidaceae bacterium]|nr:hypothetical protein [Nocardioidaceae bacterium]